MPGLVKRILRQKAVYWAPLGENETGQMTFDDPIEIPVRWEDITMEFLDKQGKTQVSRSQVFVDRVLEVGGVLWKGTLDYIAADASNPFANEDAWAIRSFNEQPDMRARNFLRWVIL